MKRYIEDKWNDYVETVFMGIDIAPDSVQYIETRRAFYAGAAGVLGAIMDATVDTTDEEDNAVADAIQLEMTEWATRMARGEV